MSARVLCAAFTLALAARGGAMTLEEARQRIPAREVPAFWVGTLAAIDACLREVRRGEVSVLATTPGGRPLRMVAYGVREDGAQRANFNSAVGGLDVSAYRNKAARGRPVVLFVGPVHGQETEGVTGLTNLIAVLETGRDLRGRDQAALRALAERCRVLIIPVGNPDGMARFEPQTLQGMTAEDLRFWGQGTWRDGTECGWPGCKLLHPMAGERVGFLGCYFDDAGVNPMHDEFFAPMGPEAPAILRVAREEGPDLAVSLHSHESAPAVLRPAWVTTEAQLETRALAERFYALLAGRKLPHGGLFEAQAEGGPRPAAFNLVSALYHTSGATSFTFECPHGLIGEKACRVGWEQILDIQLTLYEAMFQHALAVREKQGGGQEVSAPAGAL